MRQFTADEKEFQNWLEKNLAEQVAYAMVHIISVIENTEMYVQEKKEVEYASAISELEVEGQMYQIKLTFSPQNWIGESEVSASTNTLVGMEDISHKQFNKNKLVN